MSTLDPLVPGSSVSSFRLDERIGNTVWRAEDTRSGKPVAVKILTRQLPKDPQRREALVREVRQNAALYHTNLATGLGVAVAGDMLVPVIGMVGWVAGPQRDSHKPPGPSGIFPAGHQATHAL